MANRVLITGGAGFIGSHLTDELLRHGYQVRILDNLSPQVHASATSSGPSKAEFGSNAAPHPKKGKNGSLQAGRQPPEYLDPKAEFVFGDVRDPETVAHALEGVSAVFHLAAAVGVGQSMYQMREYTDVNNVGTAVLLEQLSNRRIERLVVASSMSIYGEGRYRTSDSTVLDGCSRTLSQLRGHDWDPRGPKGESLTPIATPEDKQPELSSVYALSKYHQERMCLIFGRAYAVPTVALRFFNAYGPRQALSNPYTGVLAIFASRLLNGKKPVLFEDGKQQRDFVSVYDIARACRLALESDRAPGHCINIGSGRAITVAEVAQRLAEAFRAKPGGAEITGKHRVGDIRHCFADITLATELLGYHPKVSFEAGLSQFADWLSIQCAVDRHDGARNELETRGLTL